MSESFNLRRKDSPTSGIEPVTQRITSPRATTELIPPLVVIVAVVVVVVAVAVVVVNKFTF